MEIDSGGNEIIQIVILMTIPPLSQGCHISKLPGAPGLNDCALCWVGLVFYSFSVFWDTFVYHYTRIMPNFNDMFLDNYQVLHYGLKCKNNPKWGLVSVASGSDAHLNCLFCCFLAIQTCSQNMVR
jgi:hypothetical protein